MIDDQRARHGAEIDQVMPVTVVSGRIAHRGVRSSDSARALASVVQRGRVQGKKFVIAAPVQRQLFYVPLVHEFGGLLRGRVHAGFRGVDDNLLIDSGKGESKAQLEALAHGERNAALLLPRESVVLHRDSVWTDRNRWREESSLRVGREDSGGAGLSLANGYSGSGNGCA